MRGVETNMKLLRLILRGSWGTALLGTALSLLGGGSNAALLVLINAALHNAISSTSMLVLGFVGIGFTKVLCSALSHVLLVRFAYKATTKLRRDLCRKALNTPLRQLEEIGVPKLMVALTEDVNAVSRALRSIQTVIVDCAMMLGAMVYLGWLSWPVLP
jgi:putative ATP-binding cassette transporter